MCSCSSAPCRMYSYAFDTVIHVGLPPDRVTVKAKKLFVHQVQLILEFKCVFRGVITLKYCEETEISVGFQHLPIQFLCAIRRHRRDWRNKVWRKISSEQQNFLPPCTTYDFVLQVPELVWQEKEYCITESVQQLASNQADRGVPIGGRKWSYPRSFLDKL